MDLVVVNDDQEVENEKRCTNWTYCEREENNMHVGLLTY